MIIVTGTYDIKPEGMEIAKAAFKEMIAETRNEAGCIDYRFAHDTLDQNTIVVVEYWASWEALDFHRTETPHHIAWAKAKEEFGGLLNKQIIAVEVEADAVRKL